MNSDSPALLTWIAECARRSASSPDGTLTLAAQLFAAAERLGEEMAATPAPGSHPCPASPTAWFRSVHAIQSALSNERRLRELDTAALYRLCLCALSFLDDACASPLVHGRGELFPLRSVFDAGFASVREIPLSPPLGGAVRVWRRPPPAWRLLAARSAHDGPSACFTHLDMTWDRPPPRALPSLCPVRRPLAARSHDLASPEGFSIALCPMMGAYRRTFTVPVGGEGFTVGSRVQPHDRLLEQIVTTIRLAIGNGVKCVVFPEFSVDLAARKETLQHLWTWGSANSLRTVVAGSYHDLGGVGPPYPHEAAALAGVGKPLFAQRKPGRLTLPASAVSGAPRNADVLRELNVPAKDVHVLDTEAGRFMVMIASEATCPHLPVFARAARPDFLLLMAFSSAPSAFLRVAEDLARGDITTLFVQTHGALSEYAASEEGDPTLAFARLAIPQNNRGGIPVRWRWRWNGGVEVSESEGHRWQPSPDRLQHIGHTLLSSDAPRSPLGMVLNLGAVFRALHPDQE